MPRWIVHTKSGKDYTDATHFPGDVPLEEVVAFERVVGNTSMAIIRGPDVHHLFPKTSAGVDFVMMGDDRGARPVQINWQAIGCFIGGENGEPCYRLELQGDPNTGAVRLTVTRVPYATKTGFD